MKKNRSTDTSHLIPRSRRDEGFDVESPINKEQWYYNKHHSYHDVFLNDLPHEAILRLLEMFSAVIRPEIKYEIEQVLSKPNSEIYVDEVLKLKNKVQKQVAEIIDASEFGELLDEEIEDIKNFYRNNAPFTPEEEYIKRIDETLAKGEIPVLEKQEIMTDPELTIRDVQYLLDYIKKKVSIALLEEFRYFQKTGELPKYT